MKAILLATAAFVAGAFAQGSTQSKVNPPNHAEPGPGEWTTQLMELLLRAFV